MKVQRRSFIVTTVGELQYVVKNCVKIGDFNAGQIWVDYNTHEPVFWYIYENSIDESEKERILDECVDWVLSEI